MTSDRFNIKGKIAFVTGGSRGIGLMIARSFVEAGARVYICARDEQRCDAAAATLNQLGECISLPGEIRRSVTNFGGVHQQGIKTSRAR